ncbi:hypothetical protein O3P69_002458 [Scylla paramamosain]|uniref:Uncharacterized protein n=1 Tax=Scylla paramamosain TaxID=85552 RepID=A0AAW0ULV3_SCYPA
MPRCDPPHSLPVPSSDRCLNETQRTETDRLPSPSQCLGRSLIDPFGVPDGENILKVMSVDREENVLAGRERRARRAGVAIARLRRRAARGEHLSHCSANFHARLTTIHIFPASSRDARGWESKGEEGAAPPAPPDPPP